MKTTEKNKKVAFVSFRGYTGEYKDLRSGTYYLRARYYQPTTGRFLAEDTHWNTHNSIYGDNPGNNPMPNINAIKQSSNLYVYCMSNPINYVDLTGFKAYTIKSMYGDGYELFLSPKEMDASESILGFLPFFSLGERTALNLIGIREIDPNNALFVASTATEIASNLSDVEAIPYVGYALGIYDVAMVTNDIINTQDYQISEAMFNHIGQHYFRSDTRKGVEDNYNNIKNKINQLINDGIISVKTGAEMYGISSTAAVSCIDPLTGRKKTFFGEKNYFVINNVEYEGLFEEIVTCGN